jgi:hypothetical protein
MGVCGRPESLTAVAETFTALAEAEVIDGAWVTDCSSAHPPVPAVPSISTPSE